jgi:hypothetical protein
LCITDSQKDSKIVVIEIAPFVGKKWFIPAQVQAWGRWEEWDKE